MMKTSRLLRSASTFMACLVVCGLMLSALGTAQTETATLSGTVTDRTGAALADVQIELTNSDTNVSVAASTNRSGLYVVTALKPGRYRLIVRKQGFKQIAVTNLTLNVQDVVSRNFTLDVGAVSESVTVTGDTASVNTQDAAVSTVVDRNFAENLPMNGRSFQTLIQLTPGVVSIPSNSVDNGQFSINGQRGSSNYWMVDGVSGNIGIGTSQFGLGNGLSGSNAALSVLGGTNSLVSIDAMQEFRIQTSTYAPEFGRTPGGQISIVTRSGTNQWHGSAFEYLRNDALDANDWFADNNHLPKPEERQNDFGGTLNGPIVKDRLFFFFSYEGLRLRLPQVAESLVPDSMARQNAIPSMQPFLNAFPLPSANTPDDMTNEIGQFNASFSNSARLDAYSLRIDHKVNDKLTLFGRYNYSPSTIRQRGNGASLNSITPSQITLETGTAGFTWNVSPRSVNDLRFNYSRADSESFSYIDSFGGAVPLQTLPFPAGVSASNGQLSAAWIPFGQFGGPVVGPLGHNLQQQVNIVESYGIQKGPHNLKFGVDFRRLSPRFGNPSYVQSILFGDVPSSTSGNFVFGLVSAERTGRFFFHNLGAFAQDTWRATSAFTVTYGVRWDVDFAPSSNPALLSVTGFNLENLSNLALAPTGTPAFQTTYGDVAPRVGIAYQLHQSNDFQTVVRGGFGVFYDLANSEVGNSIYPNFYPFGGTTDLFGGVFPLDSVDSAPPTIAAANVKSTGAWGVFDPHLKLPYTAEWNVAVEQGIGSQQTLSASYIGSAGRRLMQSGRVFSPNANFGFVGLIANAAVSDYDAMQLQLRRRLTSGLQALASYTWSHSIDTASAGSLFGNQANALTPAAMNKNRGPSDFDIRNAFSLGSTYQLPILMSGALQKALLNGWSIETVFQARSAPPVNVYDQSFFFLGNQAAQIRPDLVPGIPLYLYGRQYPGGKAFNNTPGAGGAGCLGPFCPPAGANFTAVQQGDLGRNALRGFGAWQWDFALHRQFALREPLRLEFRAEMFNLLNHPNFAPPVGDISNTTQFGVSTQTLGNFLAGGNVGGGALSPLYQIGGPRSMQFALKLFF